MTADLTPEQTAALADMANKYLAGRRTLSFIVHTCIVLGTFVGAIAGIAEGVRAYYGH